MVDPAIGKVDYRAHCLEPKHCSTSMAIRVGIELSPLVCRAVEVEVGRWRSAFLETRVRSFQTLPIDDPELHTKLTVFRGRPVSVVVWGALNEHRLLTVVNDRRTAMRDEATTRFSRSIPGVRIDLERVMAEIAPTGQREANGRQVMFAATCTDAVCSALSPLGLAGLRVRTVLTPTLALLSLARSRPKNVPPGATEAYVALEEITTSTALIRDGVLIASRDLPWGFLEEWKGQLQPRPRQQLAAQLADELQALFRAGQSPVAQVCICGGLSDLRSSMVPLIERLDVEVESLDALFGIDPLRLPEPAHDLREQAAALRLAWAAAVDDRAPINLLRPEQQHLAHARFARAAAVAGIAAGLGAAWAVQHSPAWRLRAPRTDTIVRQAAPLRPGRPPLDPLPPVGRQAAVRLVPAARPRPQPQPPVVEPRRLRSATSRVPRVRIEPVPARPREQAAVAPIRLEAKVDTILYGPDRRLAIVDGRIVQPGDEVQGARVVEITPTEVVVEDAKGRLRRLSLSRP